MKKLFYFSFIIITVLIIPGCSKDENPVSGDQYNFEAVLNAYTRDVVVATYNELAVQAKGLEEACSIFAESSTQANLDAAVLKWKSARAAWEASEAFLFGPVSFLSLDPSLDTWPLDRNQLENVLNSSFGLTPDFIRNGLGYSLRGFHTIEFLLFDNGSNRAASSLTDREKEYLVSCAVVLAEDAETLHNEWVNGFAAEFKSAGKTGSRYNSQQQAVLELIEGIITIADEVGNGKIGEPFTTKDVQSVESQFSWNSLEDFTNNMLGIKYAYTGRYKGTGSTAGLSEFVKLKNPSLDQRIISEIDAAVTAIGNIPHPFRNNLNASVQIQAAINACNKVFATFNTDVKELITNQN